MPSKHGPPDIEVNQTVFFLEVQSEGHSMGAFWEVAQMRGIAVPLLLKRIFFTTAVF